LIVDSVASGIIVVAAGNQKVGNPSPKGCVGLFYALQGQYKPARRNAAGNSQQPINALKGQYIS
jgi:hypothetical protein